MALLRRQTPEPARHRGGLGFLIARGTGAALPVHYPGGFCWPCRIRRVQASDIEDQDTSAAPFVLCVRGSTTP